MASSSSERGPLTPWELAMYQRSLSGRIVTATEMELILAWVRAWDTMSVELEKAIGDSVNPSLSAIRRRTRAREALRMVSMELDRLATAAGVTISDDAARLIMQAIDDVGAQLQLQQPVGVSFNRISQEQVAAIVERTTKRIHARQWPLSRDAEASMKRALARGVLMGENPNQAAARMVRETRSVFNGGLARARNIARTEMLDAHRAAAAATRKQNPTVTGWMWLADLSSRTCPACWSMHGSTHPPEVEGPYGHPSCRCTAMPLTQSWADLGFDVPDAPAPVPDAARTFDTLTEDEQRRVLGPTRYEAWRRGEYPIGDWAVTKENKDWRRSVQVSPVPVEASAAVA